MSDKYKNFLDNTQIFRSYNHENEYERLEEILDAMSLKTPNDWKESNDGFNLYEYRLEDENFNVILQLKHDDFRSLHFGDEDMSDLKIEDIIFRVEFQYANENGLKRLALVIAGKNPENLKEINIPEEIINKSVENFAKKYWGRQSKVDSRSNTNMVENMKINEGGLSDWLERQKDDFNTFNLNRKQKKIDDAKKLESDKKKNDLIVSFRNYLENNLEKNGATWNNLMLALKKKGITKDNILKAFVELMDTNLNNPSYKNISSLSKKLADKTNKQNSEQLNHDMNEEHFDYRVAAVSDIILDNTNLSQEEVAEMLLNLKDEITNPNISTNDLIKLVLKKNNIKTKDEKSSEEKDSSEELTNNENSLKKLQSTKSDFESALGKLGYNKTDREKMMNKISREDYINKSIPELLNIVWKT